MITHLHIICSACLRLDVVFINRNLLLQIEPNERGSHNNRTMMLEMFYLSVMDSSVEQVAFDGL